jgi:hypothetical protein
MKIRPRFYVEVKGPDIEAVKHGFIWLAEAAERSASAEAILAMPTKANVRETLSQAIGDWEAKALEEGRPVSLKGGVALKLVTHKMSLYPERPTPVLCVWVTKSHLDKIDRAPRVSEMCVVPYTMDDVRYWIETWQAVRLT